MAKPTRLVMFVSVCGYCDAPPDMVARTDAHEGFLACAAHGPRAKRDATNVMRASQSVWTNDALTLPAVAAVMDMLRGRALCVQRSNGAVESTWYCQVSGAWCDGQRAMLHRIKGTWFVPMVSATSGCEQAKEKAVSLPTLPTIGDNAARLPAGAAALIAAACAALDAYSPVPQASVASASASHPDPDPDIDLDPVSVSVSEPMDETEARAGTTIARHVSPGV